MATALTSERRKQIEQFITNHPDGVEPWETLMRELLTAYDVTDLALVCALEVMRAYAVDMHVVTIDGKTLAQRGICQGAIYTNSAALIERIRAGETTR